MKCYDFHGGKSVILSLASYSGSLWNSGCGFGQYQVVRTGAAVGVIAANE